MNGTDADGQGVIKLGCMTWYALKSAYSEGMKSKAEHKGFIRGALNGARKGLVEYAGKEMAIKDPIVTAIAESVNQLSNGELFTKEGLRSIASETMKSLSLMPVVEYVPAAGTAIEATEMIYYSSPLPNAMEEWSKQMDELIKSDSWKEGMKKDEEKK